MESLTDHLPGGPDSENAATHGFTLSMTTGHFKRVQMSRMGYHPLANVADDDADMGPVDGPESMVHLTDDVTAFMASIYQLAQGALAGMALLHLYITQMLESSSFVSVYSPLSSMSRRLFFILSTLALTSVIDTYMRVSSEGDGALWREATVVYKLRMYMVVGLYFVTMFVSLLMIPTDNYLAYKVSMINAQVLVTWNVMEYTRCICAMIAWCLVCYAIHEENQNGRKLLLHCSAQRKEMSNQKMRPQI